MNTLTLRKIVNFFLLIFSFSFNLNVRQVVQRRLFSGILPAIFYNLLQYHVIEKKLASA